MEPAQFLARIRHWLSRMEKSPGWETPHARTHVLPRTGRSGGVVTRARRKFSAIVFGGRCDLDSYHGKRRAILGPRAQARDRWGQDGRSKNSRDWAVSRRTWRIHAADASTEGRGGCAPHGGILDRPGRDFLQGLHEYHSRGAGRRGEGRACA